MNASPELRSSDFQVGIRLARECPELFEVAAEYPLEEFQRAIDHIVRPGRTGGVLLSS